MTTQMYSRLHHFALKNAEIRDFQKNLEIIFAALTRNFIRATTFNYNFLLDKRDFKLERPRFRPESRHIYLENQNLFKTNK